MTKEEALKMLWDLKNYYNDRLLESLKHGTRTMEIEDRHITKQLAHLDELIKNETVHISRGF